MKAIQHIAIICDGNRRWAKKNGLPEFSGHKYAAEKTVEKLINHCLSLKIPYLTFWVLSTENWRRGEIWMNQYLKLMTFFFKKYLQKLIQKGVKIRTIGNLSRLPVNVQKILKIVEKKSSKNKKITVIIAINYGGRDEVVRAIKKVCRHFRDGRMDSSEVKLTENEFSQYLDTRGLPDPDLIIRPGGEQRLSGFMLWQSEYSEFYFSKTLFPDFTPKELDKALKEFSQRQRNFGK